jgi:hypothetical protein
MKGAVLAAYRLRLPLYYVSIILFVAGFLFRTVTEGAAARIISLTTVILALLGLLLSIALVLLGPRLVPPHDVRVVSPPVRGRWAAVNSPASKVPSHGVRAYGQAHAIDLVHEPQDRHRPIFGDGASMRAPEDYPAFGQPVSAMIDGVVVAAESRRRDHRARSSTLALAYMMVEGALREFGGPGFIVGNHVTIRGHDGTFATVAHLQRASTVVRVGDRVARGELIGRCGNSGNSSEPHVHAQLMDRRSLWTAQGLPMAFSDVVVEEGQMEGLPGNDQHMVAGEATWLDRGGNRTRAR